MVDARERFSVERYRLDMTRLVESVGGPPQGAFGRQPPVLTNIVTRPQTSATQASRSRAAPARTTGRSMTEQSGGSEQASGSSRGPDRRIRHGAGLVAVAVLVFAVSRGGDDEPIARPGEAGSSSQTNSPGASSTASPSSSAPASNSPSPIVPGPTSSASVPSSSASVPSSGPTGSATGVAPTADTGTPRPTKPPVSLTAPATPVAGLTARLARIEKVQGLSNLPGEIAGPSLRITVEYDNATAAAVDLRAAVVNVYTGAALTPAIMLSQPGAKPFPASVAAGQTAQGVFVFNVPTNARSQVRVEVDLANQGGVLLFQGAVT